jgi:ABC-type sugar transport system permease subunit
MVVFSFASNMIIWTGAFSRIPDSVVEAGKLDGVSWVKEICYLTIPLVWPTFALHIILSICSFFGASGNVFLLTRGDYGTMTLNCWMYLQTLDKNNDINALNYLSAIGLLITIISISVSITVRKFANKAFADVQF